MKKTITIIIIAVAIIATAGGVAYVLTRGDSKGSNNVTTSSNSTGEDKTGSPAAAPATPAEGSVTITFTNSGFDKQSYTVKAGSVVTVKNDSNMSVQFSSGSHPTHREDPEINMKELAPGESGTITPTTKGSHDFHDHLHDQHTGILVVE